jgi:hypothetical protein
VAVRDVTRVSFSPWRLAAVVVTMKLVGPFFTIHRVTVFPLSSRPATG